MERDVGPFLRLKGSGASIPPYEILAPRNSTKVTFYLIHRGIDTKRDVVQIVAFVLESLGINVFFDKSPSSMVLGHDTILCMQKALSGCRYAPVLFSEHFTNSPACVKEVNTIIHREQLENRPENRGILLPFFYNASRTDPAFAVFASRNAHVRRHESAQEFAIDMVKRLLHKIDIDPYTKLDDIQEALDEFYDKSIASNASRRAPKKDVKSRHDEILEHQRLMTKVLVKEIRDARNSRSGRNYHGLEVVVDRTVKDEELCSLLTHSTADAVADNIKIDTGEDKLSPVAEGKPSRGETKVKSGLGTAKLLEQKAAAQDMLTCPLSRQLVEDPVLLLAGSDKHRMYDRRALCNHLRDNPNVEPSTGKHYSEPLKYTDSDVHRYLLMTNYGASALVPYDDTDFLKNHNDSSYQKLEALLYGMNRRQIDLIDALALTEQHPEDVIMISYNVLLLHPDTFRHPKLDKRKEDALQALARAKKRGLHKRAESGDALAQYVMGKLCFAGIGESADSAKAVDWFLKAAEQGHNSAQYNLGLMYENGRGVRRDRIKAVEWHQMAAGQGNAKAQYHLGNLYASGRCIQGKDDAKAVEWYRKAAEQGLSRAQYSLALRLEQGLGIDKDKAEAAAWMEKAADRGYTCAQRKLSGKQASE